MRTDAAVDWEKVELEVRLADKTRNQICAAFRITPQRLSDRIRENKWDVPPDSVAHDRTLIIGRLFWALELQIIHLTETEVTGTGEREVATLQKLATTLDKLLQIDARVTGRTPQRRQSKEMTELRTRIAKRLDELKIS